MELQNGYSGIKKIFTGEILQLVASIMTILVAFLAVAAIVLPKVGAGVLALGVMALGIISGLIALIGLIICYVGVGTAAKDSKKFKIALIFLLIGIILTIVGAILSVLSKLSWAGLVSDIIGIVNAIMQLLALIFVIGGIQEFAEKKGDLKVQGMCKTFRILLLIFYILIILANVIAFVFDRFTKAALIASAMSLIASVLSIVQYFLYLALLARAKKMLAAPSAIQAAPAQEQPSPAKELAAEEEPAIQANEEQPAIQEEPKNEDKE